MARTEIHNVDTDSVRSEAAADRIRGAPDIIRHLRRSILSGDYGYNDHLPAERELATLFNASRGTVRHVLDQLNSMNLIIRRPGRATFVYYRDLGTGQSCWFVRAAITAGAANMEQTYFPEPKAHKITYHGLRERGQRGRCDGPNCRSVDVYRGSAAEFCTNPDHRHRFAFRFEN
jgi:DNA-binding transcriptional MocR family regulator